MVYRTNIYVFNSPKRTSKVKITIFFMFFALLYLITKDLMKNFMAFIALPAENWENKQDI